MNRAALVLLALCTTASAQPAPTPDKKVETVIVTGEKPAEQAHDYIRSYAAPTPFLGQMARWNTRNPVCPNAAGFSPDNASFIVQRIKEIAGEAGAPISKNAACKPNMTVIATTVPQGVLEEIRAHRTDLLGYYDSPVQADAKTVMKYPVQALYETATIDNNGNVLRDMINNPVCDPLPYCVYAATGLRARNGLESTLYNVTIIVDARDIPDHPLGALADYLAMIALSQTDNFTPCENLPSITNLLSRDCPTAGLADAATASDIAYLRGVYKMDAGTTLQIQQDEIAGEMIKALAAGE